MKKRSAVLRQSTTCGASWKTRFGESRRISGNSRAVVMRSRFLEKELSRVTPEDIASEHSQLEDAIRKKEEEQTNAADKRGRLRQQLEQLETSEELSRLRLEEQALDAEFQSR